MSDKYESDQQYIRTYVRTQCLLRRLTLVAIVGLRTYHGTKTQEIHLCPVIAPHTCFCSEGGLLLYSE